jgi:aminoglycoside phosphotransferase family enzyme/predicted kinase
MISAEQHSTHEFLCALSGGQPVQTHVSAIYRSDTLVWKMKKSVRFDFLDQSTVAQRRRLLMRDLVLNSWAAPGLYHSVQPITYGPGGKLQLGGPPEQAVEWVLEMARVPDEDFFVEIAARGALDATLLDRVADMVAAYHAELPPVEWDLEQALLKVVEGDERAALAAGLPAVEVAEWGRGMRGALALRTGWMLRRTDAGFVRRAHGDLHLGNLCMWHGEPVPFDALEFSEDLATIDLFHDLAFLVMDLDRRVSRQAANRVLSRYLARNGDYSGLRGLAPFLSMRAMVRAHVRASQHLPDARDYLTAAREYLRPARMIVVAVGGLPGSGKSTLARALAPMIGAAPGALVLRSDETRKRLCQAAPEQRLRPAAYDPEMDQWVHQEMIEGARQAILARHAVIVDATFIDPLHRESLADLAASYGANFVGFWLEAPLQTLEQRVATRRNDASDATVTILRRIAALDPGECLWHEIDTSDAATALAHARTILGLEPANEDSR